MTINRIFLVLFFLGTTAFAQAQQTKMINVGDHSLEMVQAGAGKYTVIFESGFGSDYKVWGKVASEVMQTNQVMLYSRAGTGRSEPNPRPQTLDAAVQDLSTLIRQANLQPPFIFVGHSYGAFIIRAYAAQHPDQVKGMVFVDPAHERMMLELQKADPAKAAKDIKLQSGIVPDRFRQENELINRIFETGTLPGVGKLPQVPAMVITSVQQRANPELFLHEPKGVQLWRNLHAEFFSQFTNGAHTVTAASGHNIHREEPELVINAINQVVQAAQKEKTRQEYQVKIVALESAFEEASAYLKQRQASKAQTIVFDGLEASRFDERIINTIAYQQLSKPTTMALSLLIFKYNTVAHAASANVFDSYGEALMQQGKLKLAEEQFNKAVELATAANDASTLKTSKSNLEKLNQLKKSR